MPDRIDQFLSHRGYGSRTEVKQLIIRGRVRLDGKRVVDPGMHVVGRMVTVNREEVPVGIDSATLMFNKPLGYACSTDPREAPLIEELVPPPYSTIGVNPAGRLDRDTSGLLILTTDGGLIHRLTSPKAGKPKRYRITYTGKLSSNAVGRVAKGLELPDDKDPCRPAELILEGPDRLAEGCFLATLILTEGRYHQVRRMIAELGGEVVGLHRDRIGALNLPTDLLPGQLRELTPEELLQLVKTG